MAGGNQSFQPMVNVKSKRSKARRRRDDKIVGSLVGTAGTIADDEEFHSSESPWRSCVGETKNVTGGEQGTAPLTRANAQCAGNKCDAVGVVGKARRENFNSTAEPGTSANTVQNKQNQNSKSSPSSPTKHHNRHHRRGGRRVIPTAQQFLHASLAVETLHKDQDHRLSIDSSTGRLQNQDNLPFGLQQGKRNLVPCKTGAREIVSGVVIAADKSSAFSAISTLNEGAVEGKERVAEPSRQSPATGAKSSKALTENCRGSEEKQQIHSTALDSNAELAVPVSAAGVSKSKTEQQNSKFQIHNQHHSNHGNDELSKLHISRNKKKYSAQSSSKPKARTRRTRSNPTLEGKGKSMGSDGQQLVAAAVTYAATSATGGKEKRGAKACGGAPEEQATNETQDRVTKMFEKKCAHEEQSSSNELIRWKNGKRSVIAKAIEGKKATKQSGVKAAVGGFNTVLGSKKSGDGIVTKRIDRSITLSDNVKCKGGPEDHIGRKEIALTTSDVGADRRRQRQSKNSRPDKQKSQSSEKKSHRVDKAQCLKYGSIENEQQENQVCKSSTKGRSRRKSKRGFRRAAPPSGHEEAPVNGAIDRRDERSAISPMTVGSGISTGGGSWCLVNERVLVSPSFPLQNPPILADGARIMQEQRFSPVPSFHTSNHSINRISDASSSSTSRDAFSSGLPTNVYTNDAGAAILRSISGGCTDKGAVPNIRVDSIGSSVSTVPALSPVSGLAFDMDALTLPSGSYDTHMQQNSYSTRYPYFPETYGYPMMDQGDFEGFGKSPPPSSGSPAWSMLPAGLPGVYFYFPSSADDLVPGTNHCYLEKDMSGIYQPLSMGQVAPKTAGFCDHRMIKESTPSFYSIGCDQYPGMTHCEAAKMDSSHLWQARLLNAEAKEFQPEHSD